MNRPVLGVGVIKGARHTHKAHSTQAKLRYLLILRMSDGGGRRLRRVVHGFIGQRWRLYVVAVVRARLTVYERWTGVHPENTPNALSRLSVIPTQNHVIFYDALRHFSIKLENTMRACSANNFVAAIVLGRQRKRYHEVATTVYVLESACVSKCKAEEVS